MRRPLVRLCAFALALAALACRRERVPVEQLYTTRMTGLGHLQRNELAQAESAFVKLTEMAPDDPLGYADLGMTYLQAGRFEDAERQLREARELDGTSEEVALALARLYAITDRTGDARTLLEDVRRRNARSARASWALAELDARETGADAVARVEARLREVLAASPANLAARLRLAQALARRGAADSAAVELEEVRRTPPAAPAEARVVLDSAIAMLRAGDAAAARPAIARVVARMELTMPYQAWLEEVRGPEGPIAGRLQLAFAPKDFVTLRQARGPTDPSVVRFADVSDEVGMPGAAAPAGTPSPTALALGDVDGDGTDDLFVSSWSSAAQGAAVRLYRVRGGFVRDVTAGSGIAMAGGAAHAAFADWSNDGWMDLLAVAPDGRVHLFRNRGDGTFEDATARAGIAPMADVRRARFADLDHDGDLDLLLVGADRRAAYRNNLDGTFADRTAAWALGAGGATDAALGDLDDDGRTDVLTAGATAALHLNADGARFRDATASSGLSGGASALAIADWDNDGHLDALAAGAGGVTLWRGNGAGALARSAASPVSSATALHALDWDNDGLLDVAVAHARGVTLLHNEGAGRFVDRSAILPERVRAAGATALTTSDVDDDGDEDLLLVDGAGVPRLLRNELGNANLAANISLRALSAGSGKNNAFGIGARLELRAGAIHQTRVVTGRVTHFGLGPHLKADVLRVEWPNGVPQTVYLPGTDQDVVERELLKGSCAFAYVWDGTGFRFVSDVIWRSALGMPMGLMGSGASAYAPAGASQEYIRIDGRAMKPRNGRYVLQLTEELWETAYVDEIRLLAVDHPDSVDVFVDERFVPPGPVSLRLFQVAQPHAPLSAHDERGRDVLPALRERDDVYVADFTPSRYQGVVAPHDLVLDLGPEAARAGAKLFLRGWIYPTDASINVSLGQQPDVVVAPPSVEVMNARGEWTVAIPSIGFPSGKDKTMVIDLAGLFPTSDRRVRLRTRMQIYWDHAYVAVDAAASPTRVTSLAPLAADLHARGFSRMYRKGGRHGPFWYDYDSVTTETPWRPITGAFTRFGDVRPLLERAEDMYVVMAPGDETTVEFDASSADSLPAGWTRTFLLYTDGWIKDSDLNTAEGTTVEPLPFHGITAYPYAGGERYPTSPAHQRYLREYNTRVVGPRRRIAP